MMINKALIYHLKISLKNTVKKLVKRPLKLILGILVIAYFMMIPFMLKDLIVSSRLDNNIGYIIIYSASMIYLTMPITLSYFRRTGINFKKPDINFMFATPISPKQNLFYGIFKQIYLQVLMVFVISISAIFIFRLPILKTVVFTVVNFIISSALDYSLSMIMYGSEKISEKNKERIKYAVYLIIVFVTILIAFTLFNKGLSISAIYSMIESPLILFIPIFGYKIGFVSMIFDSLTLFNVLSSILYILSAGLLLYFNIKMKIKGEYYEDAMVFADKQAKLVKNQGKQTFLEAFGVKKKVVAYEGQLKGSGAKTIFYKQIIERRRSNRFFFTLTDFVLLVIAIIFGFLIRNDETAALAFFAAVNGVTIYIATFFSQTNKWLEEFNTYYLYLIPDTNFSKLYYSTMMEHLNSLIKILAITIPTGLFLSVGLKTIILAIISQLSLKVLLTYKLVLVEGYIGNKLGTNVTLFVNLFLTTILMIVPIIVLFMSVLISNEIATVIILAYSILLSALFINLITKVFVNIENIIKID